MVVALWIIALAVIGLLHLVLNRPDLLTRERATTWKSFNCIGPFACALRYQRRIARETQRW